MSRALPRALALVFAGGGAVTGPACAAVAGLGDYTLAPAEASIDGGPGEEAGADSSAEISGEGGTTDGRADADRANDAADGLGAGGDTGTGGPALPPADPGHVACGAGACAVMLAICCEQADADTCQSSSASCKGGVVASCDEAANCPMNQVCCVTGTGPAGLETSCQPSCQGGSPQSCRASAECGGGPGACVAWRCAGSVVATCGGAGSSAGCP